MKNLATLLPNNRKPSIRIEPRDKFVARAFHLDAFFLHIWWPEREQFRRRRILSIRTGAVPSHPIKRGKLELNHIWIVNIRLYDGEPTWLNYVHSVQVIGRGVIGVFEFNETALFGSP